METIKLVIPLDSLVLKATANVLLKLAADNSITDADILASEKPTAPGPDASGDFSAADIEETEHVETTAANTVVVAPGDKAGNEPGVVYVDADGLPWDERINASTKATLKKGGTWKLARGMGDKPDFVKQIQDELRAVMAAPGAATADNVVNINTATEQATADNRTSTAAAPPPPANTTAAAPPPPADNAIAIITKYITPDGGEYTMDELLTAGWTEAQVLERESIEVEVIPETATGDVITFPVLMSKITQAITAKTLTDEQVTAAINRQGIQALPLLSARPDLVPAVDAELFAAG